MLKDESPQVVAIVLARLAPSNAKDVLSLYPSVEQKDILTRMAQGVQVSTDMLNMVAKTLEDKLSVFKETTGARSGGMDKMAEILKHMKGADSEKILSGIKTRNTGLASRIQNKLITFSDIIKADDRGLRTALAAVDTKLLALALKVAEKNVKEKIVRNISKNRLEMLKSEFSSLGPRRVSEIEAAQNEVLAVLRKHEERGLLFFNSDEETLV